MPDHPNRRDFLAGAATAGIVSGLPGARAEAAQGPPPAAKAALLNVLNSGRWGRTTGGRRVAEFEAAFARRMRARSCVATSSGTTALLTALGALGIGPGDEVILPPYTFVATFNAITHSYALPVFVDSDAETFQIDPAKIAAAITPGTRLLLPVHIGGSPADLDAIGEVARSHKVPVIEDACQAVLAELHGRPVGTRGLAGCFSFQASKNLTSGEGGAVVTDDEAFADACYNFHTPGGARPAPSTGRGANFRLTEFQAALLLAQLARLEEQAKARDANAAYLTGLLEKVPGITVARLVGGCTRGAWHLYMFRYDPARFSGLPRARFLKELARAGIGASGGYSPLNTTPHVRALAADPHYRRLYGKAAMARWLEANRCPVNDELCEQAVWLPQAKLLGTRAQVGRIAEVIADIQKRAGRLASSADSPE